MGEKITVSAAHNDYATCRVSEDQKKSVFNVAMVSCGYCICMSGLFTGASMAMGLNFKSAIIANIIGNIILLAYGGAVGMAAAKEGVATSMLARHSFGREGSKIIGLVLAITMLGWFAVQVGFFGTTINAMFPNAGFITSVPVAAFWGGILMLLTAYFGYKGLSILSNVAVPLIFIVAIIGITVSINHAGGWDLLVKTQHFSDPMTMGAGIVLVVGSFAGGASAQGDITRYSKTPKASWIATAIGYMVANLFIIFAGYLTTLATGEGNLPTAMLTLGLGFPALLILILAQWTTNDNNLYTSALGISNVIPVSKKKITLVCGVLATLVGVAGLADYFITWLNILGIGIPPMAGIILSDYFFIKKQHYDYGPGTKYFKWNLLAFASWIIACLVGYFAKWGIASINSLIVGLIAYIILMKIFGKNNIGFIGEEIETETDSAQ